MAVNIKIIGQGDFISAMRDPAKANRELNFLRKFYNLYGDRVKNAKVTFRGIKKTLPAAMRDDLGFRDVGSNFIDKWLKGNINNQQIIEFSAILQLVAKVFEHTGLRESLNLKNFEDEFPDDFTFYVPKLKKMATKEPTDEKTKPKYTPAPTSSQPRPIPTPGRTPQPVLVAPPTGRYPIPVGWIATGRIKIIKYEEFPQYLSPLRKFIGMFHTEVMLIHEARPGSRFLGGTKGAKAFKTWLSSRVGADGLDKYLKDLRAAANTILAICSAKITVGESFKVPEAREIIQNQYIVAGFMHILDVFARRGSPGAEPLAQQYAKELLVRFDDVLKRHMKDPNAVGILYVIHPASLPAGKDVAVKTNETEPVSLKAPGYQITINYSNWEFGPKQVAQTYLAQYAPANLTAVGILRGQLGAALKAKVVSFITVKHVNQINRATGADTVLLKRMLIWNVEKLLTTYFKLLTRLMGEDPRQNLLNASEMSTFIAAESAVAAFLTSPKAHQSYPREFAKLVKVWKNPMWALATNAAIERYYAARIQTLREAIAVLRHRLVIMYQTFNNLLYDLKTYKQANPRLILLLRDNNLQEAIKGIRKALPMLLNKGKLLDKARDAVKAARWNIFWVEVENMDPYLKAVNNFLQHAINWTKAMPGEQPGLLFANYRAQLVAKGLIEEGAALEDALIQIPEEVAVR